MITLVTKGEELQVISLTPYSYMGGKGEKVLQIEVSANNATFEDLRVMFENNAEPIEVYEDGETGVELKCEYNGYSSFDCTYHNGVFKVELKKGTLTAQVDALLTSNEKLLKANAMLEASNKVLTDNNNLLIGQNELLSATITDLLEVVIPDMISGVMFMLEDHELRLGALEEYDSTNGTDPVETGTVTE